MDYNEANPCIKIYVEADRQGALMNLLLKADKFKLEPSDFDVSTIINYTDYLNDKKTHPKLKDLPDDDQICDRLEFIFEKMYPAMKDIVNYVDMVVSKHLFSELNVSSPDNRVLVERYVDQFNALSNSYDTVAKRLDSPGVKVNESTKGMFRNLSSSYNGTKERLNVELDRFENWWKSK